MITITMLGRRLDLVGAILCLLCGAQGFEFAAVGRPRGPVRSVVGGAVPRAAVALEVEAEVVSFSPEALTQLTFMREKQGVERLWLRMGVRAGGCSGMSYIMEPLAAGAAPDDKDTIVEVDSGVSCAIDPKSLMYLYGMKLGYSDELIGGGFSFFNPNAEETCGCGKSFGV